MDIMFLIAYFQIVWFASAALANLVPNGDKSRVKKGDILGSPSLLILFGEFP